MKFGNESALIQEYRVMRFSDGNFSDRVIALARETPYTLFVNDEEILSISTLPISLKELFIGFLVSEDVLTDPSEILELRVDTSSRIVSIELNTPADRIDKIRKKGVLTSGCAGGIVFSVEVAVESQDIHDPLLDVSAEQISRRMKEVDSFQGIYRITRGTHAAALATPYKVLTILEDIGRHNAIDKIIGHCFLEGIDPRDKLLLTTGRITSEAVSKAARSKFPILVSRSSASSTAVNIARLVNMDIVTYARAGKFNLFGHGGVNIIDHVLD